jgi:TPR repeat protein
MVVFGPRIRTALCVALSLTVALPAWSQTAPAAPAKEAPKTEAAPATNNDTLTIFGRKRNGNDPNVIRIDPNRASSCAFMEEYDPAYDPVVQGYLDDFNVRREEDDKNFSDNSPGGNARSGQRSSLPGMDGELAPGQQGPACNPSDRNFASGRSQIERRDRSLREAFAAFDEKKYPEALELFRKSYVKMGYDSAALMEGKMYLLGLGTKADTKEAVMWLTKVAEAPFDPTKDLEKWDEEDPSVMTPRSEAAMLLGRIHLTGWGMPKDANAARKWYAKADTFGFIPSTHIVGRMHENGIGGEISLKEAIKYYTKAGTAGYALSQYAMGVILYDGADGVPADRKLAAEWWSHAAKRGHPDALFEMGRLYDLGEVVAADPQKAIVYYKEAALKGQADAQVAIGTFFYTGEIVGQDHVIARKWFMAAAQQGNPDGMFNLGVMLSKGEGGAADRAVALIWFRLAEQDGLEKAGTAANVLEAKLTPEEKARASSVLKELNAPA